MRRSFGVREVLVFGGVARVEGVVCKDTGGCDMICASWRCVAIALSCIGGVRSCSGKLCGYSSGVKCERGFSF